MKITRENMVTKRFYMLLESGEMVHESHVEMLFISRSRSLSIQLCVQSSKWRLLNRSFQFCQPKCVNKWFRTTFRCCRFERCCFARLKTYCLCQCGCCGFFSFDVRWNVLSILTIFWKNWNIQCGWEFFSFFSSNKKMLISELESCKR